ncbi:MAG: VIT domain-containing protein [Myxococcaceae bacterium]
MSNVALKLGEENLSNGCRMVAADGRTLPLKGAALSADAKGGVVRVVLEQRFVNPYNEPLKVTYQVPLPADGAVSGFAFTIGEQRVVGEIDLKKRARERFEEAILSGRTAAILDQERSALFTQEVGNIPPHTEVVAEITIDQKLLWLPDGAWEWRFPTVVAPRYLGSPGRVADAARITVDVADKELPVKLALKLSIRDQLADAAKPFSPSHPLHASKGVSRWDVTFGDESGAALDRDVVVRWPAAGLKVGAELDVMRPKSGEHAGSAYGLVTLVPPTAAVKMEAVPRDLIVLLDTSGSMGGEPLDQARKIVSAMISTLDEKDQIELIEFSNTARRWKSRAVNADEKNKAAALKWLAALQASSSTEMRDGIIEALAPLRKDAQRQIILVTDGQIGFESEVLAEICQRLPAGSRVHTVGVGSGVNRSLTQPAARAGRGLEIIVGIGEDPEMGAKRLLERTTAPLVTEVTITGSAVVKVAPEHTPDLFAGSPALLSVALKPEGGDLYINGKTARGPYVQHLVVKPVEAGEGNAAVAALFAREQVEDLETDRAARQGDPGTIDRFIEKLGLQFQISTRLTSWVAVSEKAMVDPTAPKRSETMPHNLPYGMSAEGVGLRPPTGAAAPSTVHAGAPMAAAPMRRSRALTQSVTLGRKADSSRDMDDELAEAPAAMEDMPAEEADGFAPEETEAGEVSGSMPMPQEEEPAPAAKSTKTGGVFDKLSNLFKGKASAERQGAGGAAPPPPPAAPARPSGLIPAPKTPAPEPKKREEARKQGVRRLRAQVKLNKDGKLVLEVKVDGAGLEWAPKMIELHFADGTARPASIDLNQTTKACSASAGMVLTLSLEVGPLGAEPSEVWVTFDDGILVLAIA